MWISFFDVLLIAFPSTAITSPISIQPSLIISIIIEATYSPFIMLNIRLNLAFEGAFSIPKVFLKKSLLFFV